MLGDDQEEKYGHKGHCHVYQGQRSQGKSDPSRLYLGPRSDIHSLRM